ncbi:MAG: hypothetical protein AAB503_02545 [Patescibacteria group bacterium]
MKKIKIKYLLIAVIVLLAIIVTIISLRWLKPWDGGLRAVYLRTGDLYFGKLTHFPSFGLKQVYLLRIDNTRQDNPLSIQQFSKVFWGPKDFLSINPQEVVWTAELRSDSQLAELIAQNPELIPPLSQQGVSQDKEASGIAPKK